MDAFKYFTFLVLISALTVLCGVTARGADNFEAGVVSDVGGSWTVVALQNTYSTPVVVCVVNYANNTSPVVARVQDVTATDFELKLQNPSGLAVLAETIHYLALEEGVWQLPDGRPIEARRVASGGTNYLNSWGLASMTSFAFRNEYTAPVVLGQVMTANDPEWSVFWSRADSDRSDPPTATSCNVGKHVGEDTITTRSTETLGVIVVEEGQGDLGGVRYEAGVGPRAVSGIDNAPPYTYSLSFPAAPSVAVATVAGMNGGNGAWACLFGPNPLAATSISLVVDEDQISDTERNHGSAERVAYTVFATAVSAELTPVVTWPYATGFEPADFVIGALDGQKGWSVRNVADVQTAPTHSGSQAVALTSMSAAMRTFDPPAPVGAVWIELFCLAEPVDEFPYPTYFGESTVGVIHHTTGGVSCIDGDGAGSGLWRATGIHAMEAQPSAWTRVSLRQDYATQSWEMFVNGNRLLDGLGFVRAADRVGGIEIQSGGAAAGFLDEVRVGSDQPSVPIFELRPAAVDFGEVVVFEEKTIVIGVESLGVELQQFSGAIRGPDAGAFEITSGLPIADLAPGTSESIVLRFAPRAARSHTAFLDMGVDEATLSTTFSVKLAGTGTIPGATGVRSWMLYGRDR